MNLIPHRLQKILPKTYLYVFTAEGQGLMKVGVTWNVDRALEKHREYNPLLRKFRVYEGGNKKLMELVHIGLEVLKAHKYKDWYVFNQRTLKAIDEIYYYRHMDWK